MTLRPICPQCGAALQTIWISTRLKEPSIHNPEHGDYHFSWNGETWDDPVSREVELVGSFFCAECERELFSLQEAAITVHPYHHADEPTWEQWSVRAPSHFLMEALL